MLHVQEWSRAACICGLCNCLCMWTHSLGSSHRGKNVSRYFEGKRLHFWDAVPCLRVFAWNCSTEHLMACLISIRKGILASCFLIFSPPSFLSKLQLKRKSVFRQRYSLIHFCFLFPLKTSTHPKHLSTPVWQISYGFILWVQLALLIV